MTWAKRRNRVFTIDIETCVECGGDREDTHPYAKKGDLGANGPIAGRPGHLLPVCSAETIKSPPRSTQIDNTQNESSTTTRTQEIKQRMEQLPGVSVGLTAKMARKVAVPGEDYSISRT